MYLQSSKKLSPRFPDSTLIAILKIIRRYSAAIENTRHFIFNRPAPGILS